MRETKILIVEDELLIAKNLARKLTKLGYEVLDIVSSGAAAIKIATEKKPDLILMDIVIKGDMDGIETAAKIHEQLEIPVVYTTAYADDNTLERAQGTGAYGYAIKPFKDKDLHATIKIALSKYEEAIKLRNSLVESEARNHDKSRYISMASHDLRTPLATIQLSAYMLQHYGINWDEQKKFKHFARIKNAVTDMNELLEDILLLSKAESGKLEFNPTPLDVIGFCRSLVENLQIIASEQHRLIFHCEKDFLKSNLDQRLLRHILVNLLSNAIKYSPKGGDVDLELICEKQHLIFKIRDRGIGIPAEYKAKLFQQFERASNVGGIQGTGLGLCIVKQSVDLHEGEIMVESEVGLGTTFIVILPLNPLVN